MNIKRGFRYNYAVKRLVFLLSKIGKIERVNKDEK